MDDLELRLAIYNLIVERQAVPSRKELQSLVADPEQLDRRLQRLHQLHMIVLDDRPHRLGEIRMALPFAAEATDFRVRTESGAWYANCAWDSLAIAAAMHEDAQITSHWSDTVEPLDLRITNGTLSDTVGFIEFKIPAARWWDDIVET